MRDIGTGEPRVHRAAHLLLTTPMKSSWGVMQPEIELMVEELEERIAPAILLTNPGGNQPQGDGAENGKAIDFENPAGHAPPGWNK